MFSRGSRDVSRRTVLRGVGSVGVAGIAGCLGDDLTEANGGSKTGERAVHSEWIQAVSAEATDLSPYRISDYASQMRVGLLLDGTYVLDEDDEFYSLWVESYEQRDDETYAFTLREGLEWGEGYGAFTADDWEWFFEHVIEPDENWTGHATRGDWNDVDSVTAEDDRTFVLELARPDPRFVKRPTMWGTRILPRSLVEPYYEDWADGDDEAGEALNTAPDVQEFQYAGNLGPYSYEYREIEDRFVATRNEDYYRRGTEPDADDWANAPYFEQYTIRVIQDQTTRLSELRSGGITQTDIPAGQVEPLEEDPGITVVSTPSPFVRVAAYNQRANGWKPFRNRRVRQAFSMAVDKSTVVETIFDGHAEIAHTYQPTYSSFYDDSDVTQFGVGDSYDPEQARSIVSEELGEYEYDGDDLVGPDGSQVTLDLVYQTGETVYDDTSQYLADAYGELGVDVDRQGVQRDVMMERYVAQRDDDGNSVYNAGDRDEYTSSRDWDVLWAISLNTYPNTPLDIAPYFTETGGVNFSGYVPDDEFETLLDAARTEPALDAQREHFAELFGKLSREQPMNFILFDNTINGYHSAVVHTESPSPMWGYKEHTFWAADDVHE